MMMLLLNGFLEKYFLSLQISLGLLVYHWAVQLPSSTKPVLVFGTQLLFGLGLGMIKAISSVVNIPRKNDSDVRATACFCRSRWSFSLPWPSIEVVVPLVGQLSFWPIVLDFWCCPFICSLSLMENQRKKSRKSEGSKSLSRNERLDFYLAIEGGSCSLYQYSYYHPYSKFDGGKDWGYLII